MTTPSEDGAVRITLRDVYAVVQETHEAVVEMRGVVTAHGTTAEDHETRLRAVEKRVWQLPSIATVVAVIATGLSALGVVHSYTH